MQRILIIGNAGAGKSTFAGKLSEKLELPLVHLDKLYWQDNWEHLRREDFDQALEAELAKPQWILDGNFNRTLPFRLQHCDTVFYFDLPAAVCLLGAVKRTLQNYGKTRKDMGGNCPEYFDKQKPALYRNILTFNKEHRADYYKLMAQTPDVNWVVFRSRKEAENYLKEL